MNTLVSQLQLSDSITPLDAINTLHNLLSQHIQYLDKILQIRAAAPASDGENTFRGQKSSQAFLQSLQMLLQTNRNSLNTLSLQAERASVKLDFHLLDTLNQDILNFVQTLVSSLQALYAGKATTFANVLTDFIELQNCLLQKMLKPTEQLIAKTQTEKKSVKLSGEHKLVYVRVFHKEMTNLSLEHGNYSWIKSLFDSVKSAEKHGLAIYEHKENVIESLKGRGQNVGFVTLRINESQDISQQRPGRFDTQMGCPLLTIKDIESDNFVSLTHHGVEYQIKDNVLIRIPAKS